MKKLTITRREIDAALAHACTDATRKNLVSVKISRVDGWTRIESTDGRRLIRIQHKEEGPAEYSELLNTEDLKAASKLVSGAAANPNTKDKWKLRSFALSEKDNAEKVQAEVVDPAEMEMLASATLRTVAGTFPNTDMVLPDVAAKADEYVTITVNPQYLMDAAKALMAVCTTNKHCSVQLHIRKKDSAISPMLITGQHHENGTRGAVVIMPIREDDGVLGAPYPERETPCENTE